MLVAVLAAFEVEEELVVFAVVFLLLLLLEAKTW